MRTAKKSMRIRATRTVLIVCLCLTPWLVAQVLPTPPEAPVLASARDWSILSEVVDQPAFDAMLDTCLAVGPCFGVLTGVDLGRTRLYRGRLIFGSPYAPPASIRFSYLNQSGVIDAQADQFKFAADQGNAVGTTANVVIWNPESYEFVKHVLDLEPPRLVDPLSAGFELKRIVALPDTSPLAPPDQLLIVFEYKSPIVGFSVTARAVRLGPSSFGPVVYE